jgi:muramidase (phage lysozyme)
MAAITAEQAGGEALVKFLDLIAFSEGTSTNAHTQNDGYDVIVGGVDGHHEFTDFADHPFAAGRPAIVVRNGPPQLTSTASGRYQLLARFWPVYKRQLNLPDFGPVSQDKIALQQIKERQAIQDILAGNIQSAIQKCSNIWASFPGNNFGQGGKSMAALVERYQSRSTTSATNPVPPVSL